jgi:hypothetical protein
MSFAICCDCGPLTIWDSPLLEGPIPAWRWPSWVRGATVGFYSVLLQTFILGARRRAKLGAMSKNNPDVNTSHKTMIRSTTTNNSFQLLHCGDHHLNIFLTIEFNRYILGYTLFNRFVIRYTRTALDCFIGLD